MRTEKIACPHCHGLKNCACEVCGTDPKGTKKLGICRVCSGRGYAGIEVFPYGKKGDPASGEKDRG